MRFYNAIRQFYCGVDLHARSIYICIGNGKIDRYPLSEELRLRKLLCISKDHFKELKRAVDQFKAKKSRVKKHTTIIEIPEENQLNKRTPFSYDPTNIWYTHQTSSRQQRHFKEWFNQFDEYDDPYETMNKKLLLKQFKKMFC